jgi:hypothetical protein
LSAAAGCGIFFPIPGSLSNRTMLQEGQEDAMAHGPKAPGNVIIIDTRDSVGKSGPTQPLRDSSLSGDVPPLSSG